MFTRITYTLLLAIATGCLYSPAAGQTSARDRWWNAQGSAAGTDLKARQEAINVALRKAVEEACGVFLTSHSQSSDYKAVYDKVFASAVGYVKEYREDRVWVEDGMTHCRVSALVSTQKFESDWATIAHTIAREGYPRVIIAIRENPKADEHQTAFRDGGIMQSAIEAFFLKGGVQLVDSAIADEVARRDLNLALVRDDVAAMAAMGARFKADVVLVGTAEARYSGPVTIGQATMYRYVASLNVRAIQSDSGRVLSVTSLGPTSVTTVDRDGGGARALGKMAEEAAPKVLAEVAEAWRKNVHVSRTVHVRISPIDYAACRKIETELLAMNGIRSVAVREVTEGVASIDVEWEHAPKLLADRLGEMKSVSLTVMEFNPNRIICTAGGSE